MSKNVRYAVLNALQHNAELTLQQICKMKRVSLGSAREHTEALVREGKVTFTGLRPKVYAIVPEAVKPAKATPRTTFVPEIMTEDKTPRMTFEEAGKLLGMLDLDLTQAIELADVKDTPEFEAALYVICNRLMQRMKQSLASKA